MRILAIKNRQNELKAMEKLLARGAFPKGLVPLVEIMKADLEYDKMRDQATGEYVTEPKEIKGGKVINRKVDDPASERDVTLARISNLFAGHMVFVDYLRCDLGQYKKVKHEAIGLVVELTLNKDKYVARLIEIADYDNLMPVIAIKSGMEKLTPAKVVELVSLFHERCPERPLAIRIDELDGYEGVLQQCLNKNDFLIYDINEQPFVSRACEYSELRDLGLSCRTVLLCSPREREVNNGEFVHKEYAEIIDNDAMYGFSDEGFDIYADYGGLREKLPTGGHSKTGRALALLYDGRYSMFKSYVCQDQNLGQNGYSQIVDDILADEDDLNPNHDCMVYEAIHAKLDRGAGMTYQDWIQYTLIRYVQQLGPSVEISK